MSALKRRLDATDATTTAKKRVRFAPVIAVSYEVSDVEAGLLRPNDIRATLVQMDATAQGAAAVAMVGNDGQGAGAVAIEADAGGQAPLLRTRPGRRSTRATRVAGS